MIVRITPEYPGMVIADNGEIQGLSRWDKPIWLKQKADKDGYMLVSYRHAPARVHVIVCTAYHGQKPSDDHQVAHRNGIPSDNRASNLRWATSQENHDDMIRHGTVLKGEDHGRALFTEDQVREIRESDESGYSLAKIHGVHKGTIYAIRNRKTWRHI